MEINFCPANMANIEILDQQVQIVGLDMSINLINIQNLQNESVLKPAESTSECFLNGIHQSSLKRKRTTKIYCHRNVKLADKKKLELLMKDVIDLQTNKNKQCEILDAAKTLHSKRTRTLFHWLYPNVPKQQIKSVISSSWDKLNLDEKKFYISQAMMKFNSNHSYLMVNPQLCSLPTIIPAPSIPPTNIAYSNELHAAISSISDDYQGENIIVQKRRRVGRPPGSKNKKNRLVMINKEFEKEKDFEDDPELTNELQRYDKTFVNM